MTHFPYAGAEKRGGVVNASAYTPRLVCGGIYTSPEGAEILSRKVGGTPRPQPPRPERC